MNRKLYILLAMTACVAAFAFEPANTSLFVVPEGWPQPAYDFRSNPLTPEKIALGRALFHDPILSRDNTISCASCHLPNTAFTHIDHDLSHGIDGRLGRRNSPALVNLAWSTSFMWDGAINHLDVQSLAPIENHDEMDETLANVVTRLQALPEYRLMYRRAFNDSVVTGEHTLKALAQFMLTFVSADSRYDKVMRGSASFNSSEAQGYTLFKSNCASCHKEPLFTNGGFENNGLDIDTTLNDYGRLSLTRASTDSFRFKVPTLRNVEVSYPYMHDGRFKSLQMVLFHYTNGIHRCSSLAPQLQKGLSLSEDDKRNLIAFLKTLTDEAFLHNPLFQALSPMR
jgi:cytochrome c peroxidase